MDGKILCGSTLHPNDDESPIVFDLQSPRGWR